MEQDSSNWYLILINGIKGVLKGRGKIFILTRIKPGKFVTGKGLEGNELLDYITLDINNDKIKVIKKIKGGD